MSYEEKGTWVYLLVNLVTYVAYVAIILGRAGNAPLVDVDYVPAMLGAIGVAIVLTIVGHIAIAVAKPGDSTKPDVRDREIGRFGEYIGGTILAIAMVVPFALALAEFDYFWIANGMYLAFALSSFVGTTIKLVAYRQGL